MEAERRAAAARTYKDPHSGFEMLLTGLFGIAVVKTFYNVCMYGVEIRALGSLLSCIQKTCEGLVCLVTNGTV